MESRIEEFYREIYLLREENKVLKASEVALAKDIEMISQERDIFRQDYKDMKQANKILEKELRSVSNFHNKKYNSTLAESKYERSD